MSASESAVNGRTLLNRASQHLSGRYRRPVVGRSEGLHFDTADMCDLQLDVGVIKPMTSHTAEIFAMSVNIRMQQRCALVPASTTSRSPSLLQDYSRLAADI